MPNKFLNLTAAEEVLLAATKLSNEGKEEFTEWDITVKTWSLNKTRWGLRGYEISYPDHKRVMNEIMAGGTQKVVGKGWLEKVKPNYYKVTSAGLAKAESLSNIDIKSKTRSLYEYDAISPYIKSSIFEKYCKDPTEPKTWLGSAAFLGLKKYDSESLERKLKSINSSIKSALKWLDKNNQRILLRDDSSKPISKEMLLKLEKFLTVLEERFKAQFDAIRARKKK